MEIDPNYSEENEMDIFVNSILLSEPMPMPMDDSFIPNQHISDFDSILEWDNIVDSSIKNSSDESIDSVNLITGSDYDYEMPSSSTQNNLLELDNIDDGFEFIDDDHNNLIDSSIKTSPSDESIVNLIPGELDIRDYGYEMPSSSSSSPQNNLYVVGISENCRNDNTPENTFNSPPVASTDLIIMPSNSVEDEFNYHYGHYDYENDYGIGAIIINSNINRPPPQPQANSDNFSMSCSSLSLLHLKRVFGNRLMNIPTIPMKRKKKAEPWTDFEHKKFLIGLQMFGKGDWKSISRKLVITKTPSQVASHAQKFFIRQELLKERRVKKPSIHDITTVSDDFVKSLFGHVVDNGNSSVPLPRPTVAPK